MVIEHRIRLIGRLALNMEVLAKTAGTFSFYIFPFDKTSILFLFVKALVLTQINKLEIKDIPTPVPKKGELLIKVLASGICGTDRHIIKGEYPADLPLIMGHEFGGEVDAIGGDSEFEIGDWVSIDPNIVCNSCKNCLASRYAHCLNLKALGVTLNGGFAEFAVVPNTQAFKISKKINPLHLGLIEPLACCIRGMDLADIKTGQKVAIFGGGTMGLLLVQLAKFAGASEIVMITRQKTKRDIAIQLGATKAIDPKDAAELSNLTDVDVAFEAAGTSETFKNACQVVRVEGCVVLLGVLPEAEQTQISLYQFLTKGLRIIASYLNPQTQGSAVELVESGNLKLDLLVSKTFKLEHLAGAVQVAPIDGDIKYLFDGS